MADDVPGIKDPSEYAMPTFSSMDTTEEMKGALAVEDDPAENGAGRRVMQSVRSQEEMIHLLPEKNAAFGFKERQASISCRFIRNQAPEAVLGDKWKTIGPGGSRVSHPDLTLIKQASHPSLENCLDLQVSETAEKAARERREAKRRARAAAKRPKRSWAASLKFVGGRVVKLVDDTFLGVTGPVVAWWLSVAHGLPRATNAVQFEKDLRMPVGDDQTLSFLLLQPRNSRKKYPTILVRNPYGRLTFFYFFYLFAERGYNVVVQDVRGRGESTGVFDCITDYEDGMATLSWITSQPWYSPDHGVGLLGLSYNGFVLWSTFREGPVHPAVRAVVPINTTSRLSTINYRDGPLHLELVIRWSAYLWSLTHDTTSLFTLARSLMHGLKYLGYFGFMDHPTFTKAVRHLPVHEITERATGVQLNRFSMFMSPPGSEFVNIRAQDRALRPDVPPAQIHASWYDIFLTDSLFDYQTLVQRGNRMARIVISKEWHIQRYFCYGAVVKMALQHFRRYLRIEPAAYTNREDRVQVQVVNGTKDLDWVALPSWPPAAQWTQAGLSADGAVCVPGLTGSEEEQQQLTVGTRSYVYCPADPTPSVGGNGIGFMDAGAKDQAPLEARNNKDVLVYTSAPLQEDVVLAGHPRLVLWVRCLSPGAVSADFVGRLCVVNRSGHSINVCDGVKRVPDLSELPRSSDGTAFKVEVDIYPTTARWGKGERIRVHVASAGFIRWERNIMGYGYESLVPVAFEVLHGGVVSPASASAAGTTPHGQDEEEGKSFFYLPVVPVKSLKTLRAVRA